MSAFFPFLIGARNEKMKYYSSVLRTTSIIKERSSNYEVSINIWRIPSGKFYRVLIKDDGVRNSRFYVSVFTGLSSLR